MTRPSLRAQAANLIDHVQTLAQQLWQLAASELRHSGTRIGVAIALFVVAVFGLTFAVFFLSLGAWWALGLLIGNAWSGLVIGLLWVLIAVVLVIVGARFIKGVKGLPQTSAAIHDLTAQLREGVADPTPTPTEEGLR